MAFDGAGACRGWWSGPIDITAHRRQLQSLTFRKDVAGRRLFRPECRNLRGVFWASDTCEIATAKMKCGVLNPRQRVLHSDRPDRSRLLDELVHLLEVVLGDRPPDLLIISPAAHRGLPTFGGSCRVIVQTKDWPIPTG